MTQLEWQEPPITADAFIDPIWEQQEQLGETSVDFAQFLGYCSLRPAERTLKLAWRKWAAGTDRENSPTPAKYTDLAKKFFWAERAAAKDVYELRQRYVNWAERDWDWREEDYRAGKALREKAQKALDKLTDDDLQLDPGTIGSLFKIASELQRGAVPQIFNLTATQIQDALATLPEDKRRAVIRIMAERSRPNLQLSDMTTTQTAQKIRTKRRGGKRVSSETVVDAEYSELDGTESDNE